MYKRIYTTEIWSKVNKANKELLEDYLLELKARKRRSSTLEQYMQDGRMIMCYIQSDMDNKNLLDFTKKDFRKIALWMSEERAVSNARVNRVFSFLRSMMEYAEDEDDYDYDRNVCRKIKGLGNEPVREIHFLSDSQIHKIRNYLIKNKMYQHCVYLDLSYDSAARIGEIIQVKKEGLLDRRNTNVVIGKRGKKFPLIYHTNTLQSLKLYFDSRGEDDVENLFIKHHKNPAPLADDGLYEWCVKFRAILHEIDGTYIKFTPHSFRHSALQNYNQGTHYMCKEMGRKEGFSIEELQMLANHETMDMTKSYMKPDNDGVLQSMFNISIEK